MPRMLPPSRLLPATLVAATVVLGFRVVSLVTDAPTSGAVRQAVAVIPDAHAAAPDAAPQPAPGSTQPTPAADPAPASAPRQAVATTTPPPAGNDDAAVPDITLHQSPIEAREQQVSLREAALEAAEKHLTDRTNELLSIQSRLQALLSQYNDQNDAKWAALVKLYEGMRPRDAAVIFNGLDKSVLLDILSRMKPQKAGPVIALMQPEIARQATADLAARHTAAETATN
jgi:flagellar motility protein MotE (MotC chaperone)